MKKIGELEKYELQILLYFKAEHELNIIHQIQMCFLWFSNRWRICSILLTHAVWGYHVAPLKHSKSCNNFAQKQLLPKSSMT